MTDDKRSEVERALESRFTSGPDGYEGQLFEQGARWLLAQMERWGAKSACGDQRRFVDSALSAMSGPHGILPRNPVFGAPESLVTSSSIEKLLKEKP